MKSTAAIFLTTMFLFGCTPTNELPPISQIGPSVSEEGSLANDKLMTDVTAGLVQSANMQPSAKISKFVIQGPVGKPGERAWREMWFVTNDGNRMDFIITFREAGVNAVNFEVEQM